MKKVVIMQGVSGSGKTTYIKTKLPHAVVVSADHFFMEDGQYKFDPRRIAESHYFCWRKFLSAVEERHDLIVVDNTNTTIREISPYVLHAESFGYQVEILTVEVELDVAIERNVHGVPNNVVEAQMRRIRHTWRQMPPWWKHYTYRRSQ